MIWGFFLALFFFFILIVTAALLIAWLLTWNKKIIIAAGVIWGVIGTVIGLFALVHFLTSKKTVDKQDIIGTYIVDVSKYPGKQALWQYDHFRFQITQDDSFLFYVTDKEKIKRKIRCKISSGTYNGRLVLDIVDSTQTAVLETEPTLYRQPFSFYYVFHSKKYNNVFFKKGTYYIK